MVKSSSRTNGDWFMDSWRDNEQHRPSGIHRTVRKRSGELFYHGFVPGSKLVPEPEPEKSGFAWRIDASEQTTVFGGRTVPAQPKMERKGRSLPLPPPPIVVPSPKPQPGKFSSDDTISTTSSGFKPPLPKLRRQSAERTEPEVSEPAIASPAVQLPPPAALQWYSQAYIDWMSQYMVRFGGGTLCLRVDLTQDVVQCFLDSSHSTIIKLRHQQVAQLQTLPEPKRAYHRELHALVVQKTLVLADHECAYAFQDFMRALKHLETLQALCASALLMNKVENIRRTLTWMWFQWNTLCARILASDESHHGGKPRAERLSLKEKQMRCHNGISAGSLKAHVVTCIHVLIAVYSQILSQAYEYQSSGLLQIGEVYYQAACHVYLARSFGVYLSQSLEKLIKLGSMGKGMLETVQANKAHCAECLLQGRKLCPKDQVFCVAHWEKHVFKKQRQTRLQRALQVLDQMGPQLPSSQHYQQLRAHMHNAAVQLHLATLKSLRPVTLHSWEQELQKFDVIMLQRAAPLPNVEQRRIRLDLAERCMSQLMMSLFETFSHEPESTVGPEGSSKQTHRQALDQQQVCLAVQWSLYGGVQRSLYEKLRKPNLRRGTMRQAHLGDLSDFTLTVLTTLVTELFVEGTMCAVATYLSLTREDKNHNKVYQRFKEEVIAHSEAVHLSQQNLYDIKTTTAAEKHVYETVQTHINQKLSPYLAANQ